jgi:glycosyltransferase involved in cell wall biosynthesis
VTLVSVVIPYRGRADWLQAAVGSVLAQTFPDFELIVVDDGSDERPSFLDGTADKRIRYVRQRHGGVSVARNHGMRLATGTYIAFLDADDLFQPDKLRIQIGEMEAHPEIAMSHTSYSRIDAAGSFIEDVASGEFSGDQYPAIVSQCPIATPTVVVRREAVERDRLSFDESVRLGEDVILWIAIARRHRLLGIDKPLTSVRIHGNNAALDPKAQYLGGITILAHAFRSDPGFGFAYRRRALAEVCLTAAYIYLHRADRIGALGPAIRAAAYWPFDRRNLRPVVVLLVPRPIRTVLLGIVRPVWTVIRRIRQRDTSRGAPSGPG